MLDFAIVCGSALDFHMNVDELLVDDLVLIGSVDSGLDPTRPITAGVNSLGKNGEWAQPRMLAVQYHGIVGNDLEQWRKPGHVIVLTPAAYRTGPVMTPYQDNRK